jgi:phosphoribosylglycinamide formyltransferase-1
LNYSRGVTSALRIGVLASHEGTTLQAILDACATREIPAEVVVVVSNNSDSGALRRARTAGARAVHLSSRTHPGALLDVAIADALSECGVEVVMLAGYMKKLGPVVLERYSGRILNTHPALLPKFGGQGMYGMRVHEAVIAAGEAESGPSVHLVDAEYDTGRVLSQAAVPVQPGDTPQSLAARVQERERRLVVSVLDQLARGGLQLEGLERG